MKFTRLFLLKVLNSEPENLNNNPNPNPWTIFKEIILAHPTIDLALSLILSILLIISKISDENTLEYTHSINFYITPFLNINILLYYFVVDYLDKNIFMKHSQLKFYIFYKYWHTLRTLTHFFKVYLCLLSYFLSIIYVYLYSGQKIYYEKEKNFLFHYLIIEFYDFYSSFRFCYFFVKVLLNILLIPTYISSVILGFLEDDFNQRLNLLVDTKPYAGRGSLRPSQEARRNSEIDDVCSVCLNTFILDELVSTLPCSKRHTFHTNCLEKWFLSTVTCPLCRSDFQNSMDVILGINRDNINGIAPFELREVLI